MTRAIKMPLRSLKPEMVSDFQEMYPGAVISIEVPENKKERALGDAEFWEAISLLDWTKEGDDGQVVQAAVAALANRPVRHIIEFEDILSEKLYALDRADIASQTVAELGLLSVDGFLYDRCAVVANGKEVYGAVLHDPAKMPKGVAFGALLRLANEAYQLKTGREMHFRPQYSYETYSNKEGWPS